MRLSDVIEQFIKDMMEENGEREIQIQRNELANHFRCAPSQINYVLTTRFTTEKGYYIESKRGGGGCIIIKRAIVLDNKPLIDAINEKIGESLTYDLGSSIINALYESGVISIREAEVMKIAINDRTLASCTAMRNKVRSDMLKSMLFVVLA